MEKDNIIFLNQLIESMEEAEKILESSFKEKDAEKFNKSKRFILDVQEKIEGILNEI